MPSASAAPAHRRHRSSPRGHSRPRHVPSRAAKVRVRWDRLGRIALLVVLTVVVGLYVKQGFSLLSIHSQAQKQLGIVQQLVHDNARLRAQQKSLNDPATIMRDARMLGMVRVGEHPYVISGLPSR
jgi:cell division protein FtsB